MVLQNKGFVVLFLHYTCGSIKHFSSLCLLCFLFFFLCTLASHPVYLFSAFYNTTISLASLSQLYDCLRLSSPYIHITLTLYTPLPYLYLRFYSIFASPFYYCYYTSYGPSLCFPLDLVSLYYPLSDIFLPISMSPPFHFPSLYFSIVLLFSIVYFFIVFSSSNHIISSYLCYF